MKPFAQRLLELLPEIYSECDTSGDLKAFLSVVGPTLDDIKTHIDGIPALSSPKNATPDFLWYLAALIGAAYDSKVSPTPQRRRIMEAIERYKRIGTTAALKRELQSLGWNGEIIETFRFVLRLNYRSKLNHQKLPGRRYNHGIYGITQPLDDAEFHRIAALYQPAGTICWIGEESQTS